MNKTAIDNLKKSIGAAFAVIGSVIGAGFITGSEILAFFHGQTPLIVFLCLFAAFTLLFCLILKSGNQVSVYLLDKGDKVIILFNFISVASMLGATESLASDLGAGCAFPVWSVALLIITVAVCRKGMRGLSLFNVILVPVMLAAVFLIVLLGGVVVDGTQPDSLRIEPFSVLEYVGMNVLLTGPLLSSIRRENSANGISQNGKSSAEKKKEKTNGKSFLPFVVSVVASAVLSATAAAFLYALPEESAFSEIPILYVAGGGKVALAAISFVVALGIITTLVGSLYPILELVKGRFSLLWAIGVCLVSLALSRIGFKVIVAKIYPAIGVLAIAYYALTFFLLPSAVHIAERGRTLRRQAGTKAPCRSLRGRV